MLGAMPKQQLLLSSTQVCDQLGGIDRSTLSRWVQLGKITPLFKHPGPRGAFVFTQAEVDRFKKQQAAAA